MPKQVKQNQDTDKEELKVRCTICNKSFAPRGLHRHQKACAARAEEERLDAAFRLHKAQQKKVLHRPPGSILPRSVKPWENLPPPSVKLAGPSTTVDTDNVSMELDSGSSTRERSVSPSEIRKLKHIDLEFSPEPDTIRVQYHPRSLRPQEQSRFEDYRERRVAAPLDPPPLPKILDPFSSRLDFEVAELAHDLSLSKNEMQRILDIILEAQDPQKSKVSFRTVKDIEDTWATAALRRTQFKKCVVPSNHLQYSLEHNFHMKPLWNWAVDLVQDKNLAPHFEWDARHFHRYDAEEKRWVRFVHEPWSADSFWRIQSNLSNPKGKLLPFILYADKTKLASFGGATGYPVYARLANLPAEIRNSKRHGGGELVGWLPIVENEESEANKAEFVDFKRAVWHDCFYQLLESIGEYSSTGCWIECGDGQERCLFPVILILSADYEEQCVMALIRGAKADHPCPVCLVHRKDSNKIRVVSKRRTLNDTDCMIKLSRQSKTKKEAENIRKSWGARNVLNAFLCVAHSDPYQALSWDRMHNYAHGVGGLHLWPAIIKCLDLMGSLALDTVDKRAAILPRWSGLSHFNKIVHIKFSDANKHEDILKIALYLIHDLLLTEEEVLLLQCVRHYVIIDLYMSFEVHDEITRDLGIAALTLFSETMRKYADYTMDTDTKKWLFPKLHTHFHAFYDIWEKGVTRNYNTKFNEAMHGPIKKIYQNQTNFKNIDNQITNIDHSRMVMAMIRNSLEEYDLAHAPQDPQSDNFDESIETTINQTNNHFSNIIFGAQQKKDTIAGYIAMSKETNRLGFQNFLPKLLDFLKASLHPTKYDSSHVHPQTLITEFRFIKTFYESKVTWRMDVNYLRSNPFFHNHPRFDCVMFNTDQGPIFAQLLFMFTLTLSGTTYPITLIQAYDKVTRQRIKKKDKELGLIRLRQLPPEKSEFIFANSIIRGALIFPAFDEETDSLVCDVVDADMMLRMEQLCRKGIY